MKSVICLLPVRGKWCLHSRVGSTEKKSKPSTLCDNFVNLDFTHFSEIYCHGRLLDTVQMARIYNDSKTFVDMKLKQNPDITLKLFDEFMTKYPDSQPSKDELQKWVEENFEERGSEFEQWIPDDFKKNPEILNKINDKELRNFAQNLNGVWLELGRQMKKDVANNSELYSSNFGFNFGFERKLIFNVFQLFLLKIL